MDLVLAAIVVLTAIKAIFVILSKFIRTKRMSGTTKKARIEPFKWYGWWDASWVKRVDFGFFFCVLWLEQKGRKERAQSFRLCVVFLLLYYNAGYNIHILFGFRWRIRTFLWFDNNNNNKRCFYCNVCTKCIRRGR